MCTGLSPSKAQINSALHSQNTTSFFMLLLVTLLEDTSHFHSPTRLPRLYPDMTVSLLGHSNHPQLSQLSTLRYCFYKGFCLKMQKAVIVGKPHPPLGKTAHELIALLGISSRAAFSDRHKHFHFQPKLFLGIFAPLVTTPYWSLN